ncbi:protein kinase domain-containing protein [Sorangium sp. So ce1099]|uniref:serine/threonine-protein kinase n=1 Tax=Sorangium sp. So ce1099 TaxID=3133331 RepID=UPI003F63B19E
MSKSFTQIAAGLVIAEKYKLVRRIGEGSMGVVWAALNLSTSREVALKLIHRPDPELRRRLQREGRNGGALRHRNVIDMYDMGETDFGEPFLVMQLLAGETLAELLQRRRRLDADVAASIGRDVARGLSAVHALHIVHRDLKPANIFLHREPDADEPVVKVLDFGVAKNLAVNDGVRTATGGAVGSPLYMSPEQVRAEPNVDHRADIWALGVVLFEMLTGMRPFQGDARAVFTGILTGEIPKVSRYVRRIDPGLVELVARCMARHRDDRIGSAAELADLLEGYTGAGARSGAGTGAAVGGMGLGTAGGPGMAGGLGMAGGPGMAGGLGMAGGPGMAGGLGMAGGGGQMALAEGPGFPGGGPAGALLPPVPGGMVAGAPRHSEPPAGPPLSPRASVAPGGSQPVLMASAVPAGAPLSPLGSAAPAGPPLSPRASAAPGGSPPARMASAAPEQEWNAELTQKLEFDPTPSAEPGMGAPPPGAPGGHNDFGRSTTAPLVPSPEAARAGQPSPWAARATPLPAPTPPPRVSRPQEIWNRAPRPVLAAMAAGAAGLVGVVLFFALRSPAPPESAAGPEVLPEAGLAGDVSAARPPEAPPPPATAAPQAAATPEPPRGDEPVDAGGADSAAGAETAAVVEQKEPAVAERKEPAAPAAAAPVAAAPQPVRSVPATPQPVRSAAAAPPVAKPAASAAPRPAQQPAARRPAADPCAGKTGFIRTNCLRENARKKDPYAP